MKFDPTFVVNSPPTHQGSVLGRIVAGDTRLGETLANLVRWKSALDFSIAETLAELAALRTPAPINCKHGMRKDWCALCKERLDYLAPELRNSDTDFHLKQLNKHRGCFSGLAYSDPITVIPSNYNPVFRVRTERRPDDWGYVPMPRTVHVDPLPRKATPYDPAWDALRQKALEERYAGHLNWCPTCKEYVKKGHDGPNGIECEDYMAEREKKAKQRAAKAAKKFAAQCAEQSDGSGSGYGPINLNHQENRFIARLDAEKHREAVRREKRRKSSHLAAKQAEMRVRAKVRARGKARKKKTVR